MTDRQWDRSWYTPGDWALPTWWTAGVQVRGAVPMTHAQQQAFYSGPFVRDVLGHSGGLTTLPK